MECNQDQEHGITLEAAVALTRRYRLAHSGQIKGGFFGKDDLLRILDQTDCTGIKFYYGLDALDQPVLVLVGAESNCDDLTDGVVLEISLPCPDYCGSSNSLNS